MKHLKTYENSNDVFDTHYEFYRSQSDGSQRSVKINTEFYHYDNYDLDSMIDVYLKIKGDEKDFTIKKVTIENVDLYKNPKYTLAKDIKKYNL